MRRNLFLTFVLAVFCFAGAVQVKAQEGAENVTIDPELKELADLVLAKQIEDFDAANKIFTNKIIRKYGKKAPEMYQFAKYFNDNNFIPGAKMCIDKAYAANATDINTLMLRGELAEKMKNWGAAGQAYEEVLSLDTANVTAMKKIADVYKYVNPEVAKEYLFKVKAIDPNDVAVDKDLGLIYYRADEMKDAAKYYRAYYKGTPTDQVNLFSCEQYVNALFLTKGYSNAINVCKAVAPRDPENKTFKSVKFWSLVENYELAEAREAMAYITNKEYPDSTYGYWDYYYAGRLAKDESNLPEAIKWQTLAVEKDPERAAGLQELNNLLQENRQYADALPVYKAYLGKLKELNRAQATDTFKLGYLYFTLAQVDSVKRAEWIKEGDAIFEYVSQSAPDSYMGPIFRARINNVGVSEPSETVKAHYEEAAKRIGDNAKAKTDKLECLQYAAFYDIQKDNYPEALQFILEMEALDPENPWTKRVKPFVESQIPQE
ncbi:MAG: hypothetical protein IKB97_09085 [Bacteroidaceae bacterium]|nr:hypothetical protein [Bacteroidaceae bacterium]